MKTRVRALARGRQFAPGPALAVADLATCLPRATLREALPQPPISDGNSAAHQLQRLLEHLQDALRQEIVEAPEAWRWHVEYLQSLLQQLAADEQAPQGGEAEVRFWWHVQLCTGAWF